LAKKYPPPIPYACDICLSYCLRPGWWTVKEAALAIEAGYAGRMMLEISPELNFGVLVPAFKGNEANIASQLFAPNGCTFLQNNRCEIFDSGFQPLECRFCFHARRNQGKKCHSDIEKDWHTSNGQKLIIHWGKITGW